VTLRAASLPAGADPRLAEASRALEAMLLKQIVSASGTFKGGESAGSAVRADLFATTLADAVASSGGIGIADQLVRSLTPGGGAGVAPPSPLGVGQGVGPVSLPGPWYGHSSPSGRVDSVTRLAPPVAGPVTSGFGVRQDPLTGEASNHPGMDFGAPAGTPIRAPARGVVLSAGPRGGYGNAVEIDHGNGLVTLYGHAAELLVSKGDSVEPGQEIATVGSSGRSTGPHLHFELHVGGRTVDPGSALKKYGLRTEGFHGSGP
jgi:murein DD-endopeptidase MepM/ murein hydrolase activator NlpD